MPVLCLQTPRTTARLEGESLRIRVPASDDETGEDLQIPLPDIERVVLAEGVSLTAPALCELMSRSVPVAIVDWRGRFLGSFEPPTPSQITARQTQYRRSVDVGFSAHMSRALIRAKLMNSRRLLQRLNGHHALITTEESDHLSAFLAQASANRTLNELRGNEGAAAVWHYHLLARFFPAAFPFERRSKRPPHNPVNAVLSYLSTLVYGELLSVCHSRGLDPALGHLHVPQDGRWSLPLDLMEPFRPAVVDALTLRFFTLRILNQGHFEPHQGGIYLNPAGRRLVHEHYEQKLTRPFLSEHAGCRTTLRQLFTHAVLRYKQALSSPETFAPFLMN